MQGYCGGGERGREQGCEWTAHGRERRRAQGADHVRPWSSSTVLTALWAWVQHMETLTSTMANSEHECRTELWCDRPCPLKTQGTHVVQALARPVDGAAVHHAVVQEQLVHVVARVVVLLDVLAAACGGATDVHWLRSGCAMGQGPAQERKQSSTMPWSNQGGLHVWLALQRPAAMHRRETCRRTEN